MKKLVALFLCVFMIFSLSGCGKKDKKDVSSHPIDVEYYAKVGQIPEHKYHLGSDAEEMRDAFKAEDQKNEEENQDGHTHSVYSLIEEDEYNILSYKNANYYYKQDGKVSAIVSLDNSYEFNIGDLSKQITDVLGETEEKDGDRDVIFFLPMPEIYTYLEYTFGENHLIFVFEDNSLCATMLYNPEKF